MVSLTTRQRDVLRILLDADKALPTNTMAQQLQLTPRQVNYSLKGVQRWLSQHDVELLITPGIGAKLVSTAEQNSVLADSLQSDAHYQLILTPSQRQQLFLFQLLVTIEPLILYQLQQRAQVSRTTILKDLSSTEKWLERFRLRLERRPNYGIEIVGLEQDKRQALIALMWNDPEYPDPLWQMTHTQGLVFALRDDASLLQILEQVNAYIDSIKARAAITSVAHAEAALGGRFSDMAVLFLALTFAIQRCRIDEGFIVAWEGGKPPFGSAEIESLHEHPIWPVAKRIFLTQLQTDMYSEKYEPEVAFIAAHLLGSPRNDNWPIDVESEKVFSDLVPQLMRVISDGYKLPDLLQDSTLRAGLLAHVVPACLRQTYRLWMPAQRSNRLQETYSFELALADQLRQIINRETGAELPSNEVNNLALLIRAAYIRERPNRLQQVVVVCPSGMATAQLLTARLKARFPRLGTLEVLSMRELSDTRLGTAELILTTVPLPDEMVGNIKVIQVHPLLLPEDIERITQWLA